MLPSCRYAREFPASLSAGDSWAWTLPLSVAVPAGATLIYSFRAGPVLVNATGARAVDGLSFEFTLAPADTAKLPVGSYPFFVRLTVGASVQTIRSGQVKITPNLADPDAETRTKLQIRYDDLQKTLASLERRTNNTFSSPGGASYSSSDVEKMQRQADRLKQQLDAERGRSGAVTIRTAFGSRGECGIY